MVNTYRKLFLVALVLYGLTRLITDHVLTPGHWLNAYGTDILALPVFIPFSVILAQHLGLLGQNFRVGTGLVLGAVTLFSVWFEGLAPLMTTQSTQDPVDVLAYALGGALVLFLPVQSNGART